MHIRSTVAATLLLAGSPFVQARYDYSSGETDAVKAESAKADSSYGDDYSMSAGADSSTTGVSQAQGAASWSDSDKTNGGSVKADSNYGDSYDGSSYGDDYSMGAEPPATVAAAGADSSTTDVSQAEGAASWSGSRETDGDSVKADSNYGDSYDGSSYGDDYSMSAEPSATAAGAGAGSATTDVSQTEGAAPLSGSDGTNTDSVKADSGYGDWSDDDDDDSMSIEPSATAAAAGADSSATDVSEAEGAAPSSGSDGTTVHVVSVGDKDGGLIFSPADIKAAAGDVVQFQFWPKNHSVVQSTFDEPCEPIAKNSNVTGFFSGFMPVSPDDTTMPTYTIPINDTKPIWFYCSQGKGKHCQGSMVGVINAPAGNASRTLESHRELAAKAGAALIPGQDDQADDATESGYGGSTTLATSTTPAATGGASETGSGASNTTVPLVTENAAGSDRLEGRQRFITAAVAAGLVGVAMGSFM